EGPPSSKALIILVHGEEKKRKAQFSDTEQWSRSRQQRCAVNAWFGSSVHLCWWNWNLTGHCHSGLY
ncbi:hypothetical protein NDU88_001139, partial [Pleurodeles waltl]